jgi:hypothetical protein
VSLSLIVPELGNDVFTLLRANRGKDAGWDSGDLLVDVHKEKSFVQNLLATPFTPNLLDENMQDNVHLGC